MLNKIELAAIVAASALLAGCVTKAPVEKTIVENSYVQYLEKVGYTRFLMPSTLQSAGALVAVDKDAGLIVKGDLRSCGLNDEAILYSPDPAKANDYKNGKFPNFTGTGENDFGLGIVASVVGGVGGSLNAKTVRKVTVEASDVGEETLNSLLIRGFLNDPARASALNKECLTAIESGNVAIITQSAYIQAGAVTFYGKDDYSAKLDGPAVIKALNLNVTPNMGITISQDGKLTFDKRTYVAFKLAYRKGPPGTPSLGGESGDGWNDVTVDLHGAAAKQK